MHMCIWLYVFGFIALYWAATSTVYALPSHITNKDDGES